MSAEGYDSDKAGANAAGDFEKPKDGKLT